MAIHDSLPERRNLVVTSTAFIIFYAAGGVVYENVIRLSVVNVEFQRPEVLALSAWILLFWFALRFWQATKSKFSEALKNEAKHGRLARFWAKKACTAAEAFAAGKNLEPGYTIEAFAPEIVNGSLLVYCSFIYVENGSRVSKNQERVSLSPFYARSFLVFSLIKHGLLDNAFSEFIVPYFLFFAAVLGPLWSCAL